MLRVWPLSCAWMETCRCRVQVDALEKGLQLENLSELEALLDSTRQEKENAVDRASRLRESLTLANGELVRLRDAVARHHNELEVSFVAMCFCLHIEFAVLYTPVRVVILNPTYSMGCSQFMGMKLNQIWSS